MARRRHAAAAGRILATGVALGAFGGAIGLMAGPAPAAVRTVTVPVPPHVVWVEVRHHPAPPAAVPPAATGGGGTAGRAGGRTLAGASPSAAAGGPTSAPAATPAIAPAPAAAPKPVTTTRAS